MNAPRPSATHGVAAGLGSATSRAGWLWIAATLVVYVGALGWLAGVARDQLRTQVLDREARVAKSVVQLEVSRADEEWKALGGTEADDDLLSAVAESAHWPGVLALRVYGPDGEALGAVPALATGGALDAGTWASLRGGLAVAHLWKQVPPDVIYGLERGTLDAKPLDLLEVVVPLSAGDGEGLRGAVHFWLDGGPVLAELARLDRGLFALAGGAALVGSLLIGGGLGWAWQRLRRSHALLHARQVDLARANAELLLAAKTSALGAISAHLLHGLKNPLAGLEGFVADGAAGVGDASGTGPAWEEAAATTRRLRELIDEVGGLLRDEAAGVAACDFGLSPEEITTLAVEPVRGRAKAGGVRLVQEPVSSPAPAFAGRDGAHAEAAPVELDGRTGRLLSLALGNLVQNAVEASAPGATVSVRWGAGGGLASAEGCVWFQVEDMGPGLPDAVRARLFTPVGSCKPGGSGLGLAISAQLARIAGGRLELVESGGRGTRWLLVRSPAGDAASST